MLQTDMQIEVARTTMAHPGRVGVIPKDLFGSTPWFKAFEHAALSAQSYAPQGVEQHGNEIVRIVAKYIESILFLKADVNEVAQSLQVELTRFIGAQAAIRAMR